MTEYGNEFKIATYGRRNTEGEMKPAIRLFMTDKGKEMLEDIGGPWLFQTTKEGELVVRKDPAGRTTFNKGRTPGFPWMMEQADDRAPLTSKTELKITQLNSNGLVGHYTLKEPAEGYLERAAKAREALAEKRAQASADKTKIDLLPKPRSKGKVTVPPVSLDELRAAKEVISRAMTEMPDLVVEVRGRALSILLEI